MELREKLEQDLDEVFSFFIRLRHADHSGFVSCYTCFARHDWRATDCGHWKGRAHHGTRWSEKNCQVQCVDCNRIYGGRPEAFEEALREDYGDRVVETIIEEAKTPTWFQEEQLRDKISYYKAEVEKLGKTC